MTRATADGLVAFIAAGPSPFHCVAHSASLLEAAGYQRVDEAAEPVAQPPGAKGYVVRGGALVAWRMGSTAPAAAGFRLLGAHTDSPNLRIKPRPDVSSEGWRQLGVEPYGGLVMSTWADRDLGISGHVMVRGPTGPQARLFQCDEPVARVPNLAIHLNREVNKDGHKLNAQTQLVPVVGLGEWEGFAAWLATGLGVAAGDILSWELGLHDVQAPVVGGIDEQFVFAPRLDNQASCYAALCALLEADPGQPTQVVALFDHEEIGSRSWRGAMGPMLEQVLGRLVRDATEQAPGGLQRATACSWMVSADMAHGVHPSHADKHEPQHKPLLGQGPVLKTHSEQRYATDAEGMAFFRLACAEAEVPCQDFVSRSDLPCGSTIGPISAGELGIRTVDVGCAMLSMHSIREQAATADVPLYARALRRCLER